MRRHPLLSLAGGALLLASACGGSDDSTSSDPSTDPAVSSAPSSDPPGHGSTGGEPGSTGGEPGSTGGEPGSTGGEPGSTGGEPGSTGGEPGSTGGAPTVPLVGCTDLDCGFAARVCDEPEGQDARCGDCLPGYADEDGTCVFTDAPVPFPGTELVAPMTFGEPALAPGADALLDEGAFQFRQRQGADQLAQPEVRVVHLAADEVPGRMGENVLAFDIPQVLVDTLYTFVLLDESFPVQHGALYRMGGAIGLSALADEDVPAGLDFGIGLIEPADAPHRQAITYATWSWAEALEYETGASARFADRQLDYVGMSVHNGRTTRPGIFVRVNAATGPVRILVDNLRVSRVEDGTPLPAILVPNGNVERDLLPVDPSLALMESATTNLVRETSLLAFAGVVRHRRDVVDMGTGRAEQCLELGRTSPAGEGSARVRGRFVGDLVRDVEYDFFLDLGARTDVPVGGLLRFEVGFNDAQGFNSLFTEILDFSGGAETLVPGETNRFVIRVADFIEPPRVSFSQTISEWRVTWESTPEPGLHRILLCGASVEIVDLP
ncbi:MAG: hypothetical protein EA398_08170 [Deltaproteobacteria bacterium]|nr:MAG: hypothetical protein EA398_08170 [Deltaproteobacteria bacterium]